MSKTNSGLLSYAKAQVGLPYWYGTFGQTASASLYASKKAQYPDSYTASDFASQYGKRVHDCVGLIKGYLWSDSTTSTPTYNAAQDKSASGMYAAASTKGKISTFPKTAGLLVFKGTSTSKITHVGVYNGTGYVYEAKGHAYGVVKTKYAASDWNYWAQCPYTTDDTTGATSTTTTTTTTTTEEAHDMDTLRNGDTGQQVTVLQKLLNQLGSSLTEDGDFGSKTEAAVKSYQKKQGLTQDGICGPKTWAAILAV